MAKPFHKPFYLSMLQQCFPRIEMQGQRFLCKNMMHMAVTGPAKPQNARYHLVTLEQLFYSAVAVAGPRDQMMPGELRDLSTT